MTLPCLCVNYDAPPMRLVTLIAKHYTLDIRSSGTSWGITFSLGKGVIASVIMSEYAYCAPREYRNNIDDYAAVPYTPLTPPTNLPVMRLWQTTILKETKQRQ